MHWCLGMLLAGMPLVALAQSANALDRWIVQRFRGAQLLPDQTAAQPTISLRGAAPRIESVQTGTRADTLWALHFGADSLPVPLGRTARVQLVGPSGTIMPMTVRLLERRAFRAPRTPRSAAVRADSSWRYAWAYLAVIPHRRGSPPSRYRGWLLLPISSPASPP